MESYKIFPCKIMEYPFYISRVLFTVLSDSLIVLDLQINMITTIQWESCKDFSTRLKMFTTEAEFCCAGKSLLHCYNDIVGEISGKRSAIKFYFLFAIWILILYLIVSICLDLVNMYYFPITTVQSVTFM